MKMPHEKTVSHLSRDHHPATVGGVLHGDTVSVVCTPHHYRIEAFIIALALIFATALGCLPSLSRWVQQDNTLTLSDGAVRLGTVYSERITSQLIISRVIDNSELLRVEADPEHLYAVAVERVCIIFAKSTIRPKPLKVIVSHRYSLIPPCGMTISGSGSLPASNTNRSITTPTASPWPVVTASLKKTKPRSSPSSIAFKVMVLPNWHNTEPNTASFPRENRSGYNDKRRRNDASCDTTITLVSTAYSLRPRQFLPPSLYARLDDPPHGHSR